MPALQPHFFSEEIVLVRKWRAYLRAALLDNAPNSLAGFGVGHNMINTGLR
jgi:hypothetical protein